MTEASIMLLYSMMNGVPVLITGLDSDGNPCDETYGCPKTDTVYSISKVSNAGRHELCVYFDGSGDAHYYDPARIKVSLV